MKYFLIFAFVLTLPLAFMELIASKTVWAETVSAVLFTAAMIQATGAAICQRLEDLIAQGKPKTEATPKDNARDVNYSGSFSGGGPE